MHVSAQAPLADLSRDELEVFLAEQKTAYDALLTAGLKLDLTRGKPSPTQLDLADGLLALPVSTTLSDGTDARNYGGLAGVKEIREIFGELLGLSLDQITAQGASSLTLMKDTLVNLLLKGGVDSERPWIQDAQSESVKFICPVPGYDRHFTLLEWLGIETIPVAMTAEGPDVDAIEKLVAKDASIKGIWVVPTYANPTGFTTSTEVARRLAAMETAAPDFIIMWDNAYALHHLTETETETADIVALAAEAGHPNRPIVFASTSKITYAGAGVAFLGGSAATVAWFLDNLGFGSIGPDKVNQLRHLEFFGDAQGVRDHMVKHTELLAPRFAAVEEALSSQLAGLGIATWTNPTGGYFVNLDVHPGTASRVISLAKAAGVALTPAGSAFPGRNDPRDENIRLAPSFPSVEDVAASMSAVAVCVKLAAAEALLGTEA